MKFVLLHKHKSTVEPLPYAVYFWSFFTLAAAALANAVYLSISHYRVYTDIGYKSFCALSKAINCDTVSQSPYSIFMNVPVPIWGILGFVLILVLLPFANRADAEQKRIWTVLMVLCLLYSLYSLLLAGISAFLIHSYCIMCILSYALTFALLYLAWLIRRRFDAAGFLEAFRSDLVYLNTHRFKVFTRLGSLPVFALALILFMPAYWSLDPPLLPADIPRGTTPEGDPWIGTADAQLVIYEYADYMCFQCHKSQFFLRELMLAHPGKIKLIHRHFPMDHTVNPLVKVPFHIGSGAMALIAIYAHSEGKFWQMNDYLFKNAHQMERINVGELADAVGLNAEKMKSAFSSKRLHHRLRSDIIEGLKLGINGTPSFVIEGKVYSGQIPAQVLASALK